jgi:hypothetical protein
MDGTKTDAAEELKHNVGVCGLLFPEPVHVILPQPIGGSVKLIGKGLRSSKVYDPILSAEQLGQINSSPARAPFDGDTGKFRFCIEGMCLDLAYELAPHGSALQGSAISFRHSIPHEPILVHA